MELVVYHYIRYLDHMVTIDYDHREKARAWCRETVKGHWGVVNYTTYWFAKKKDAALFAIFWGK